MSSINIYMDDIATNKMFNRMSDDGNAKDFKINFWLRYFRFVSTFNPKFFMFWDSTDLCILTRVFEKAISSVVIASSVSFAFIAHSRRIILLNFVIITCMKKGPHAPGFCPNYFSARRCF